MKNFWRILVGVGLLGSLPALRGQGFSTVGATPGGVINGNLKPGAGTYNLNYAPVINVTLAPFNADPSGATDATAAINAAIQFWSTNWGRIYLPAGRYLISSTLNLCANSFSLGSGNAGSWTNHFEFYGDGDSTILDCRFITAGPVIQFLAWPSPTTNLYQPYFHDFRMYGNGWSGGADNSGTINPANQATAIFLGYAGQNHGSIAGGYDVIDRVNIDFFFNGIVHSNWVTSTVRECNFQQNSGSDILDAHDDSVHIEDCLSAMLTANFVTNHAFVSIVGTPNYGGGSSPDSGNGHVLINNEVDGVAVFGDGLRGFYWNGGDIEDPTSLSQACFILTNCCQATFENPYVIGNMAGFGFGWWFQNPASGVGNNGLSSVFIHNPNGAISGWSGGVRNNLIRYDDANSNFYPPCLSLGGSGQSPDNNNNPGYLVCLYNTNTWQAIPRCETLPQRDGTSGELFGASRNLGKLFLQNSQKGWRMGFASYTNGPSQSLSSGLAVLGPDVAGMEYRGQSGVSGANNGNALQIGSWSDSTPGLDWLEIDIASANGGTANRAAYWSGIDYGTYMQANGIQVVGNNSMIVEGTGIYYGNNAGLTNAYSAKAADYALLSSDTVIFLTGAHKATMPNPAAEHVYGKAFWVICSSPGTNAILPNGAETFTGKGMAGAAKWTNSAVGNATCLMSDGANWWILKTDN